MTPGTDIISFSAPRDMASRMEALAGELGYTNRSEMIRDALRAFMKGKLDVAKLEGTVEGVVIALYDHSAGQTISDIRHGLMDIIRSYMHTDFDHGSRKCCDVLFVSGSASRVKELVFRMGAVKGVGQVELFVAQ